MKSEKKVDKSKVELRIELDEKEWQEAITKAAQKLSEGVNIAGFRPGKAPLEVVINHLGETRITSEAAEMAINKFYIAALKEHQTLPIVSPKISVEKVGLKDPLIFKAEIIVMPEVKLGDYSQIKVEKKEVGADPARIEGVLKNIQRQQAKFNPVEREAKQGDWVEIDFEGKIDGKVFEGGSSKNHPLIIGDGVLLPDFESALIGMKIEEEKTFSVNFPEDYHQSALTGKSAEFTVKLHKIKEVILPELNDDLAKAAGDFKTLADLKKNVEKFLREDMQQQENDRQKEEAITQLIKLAEVDLPNELVEQEIASMMHDLEHQLEHRNLKLEDYLEKTGVTAEKLREDWQETAKKRVLAGLVLNEFRKQEHIEATDEDITKEIERLKSAYPEDKDKIEEKYKNEGERNRLKTLLSGQQAIDRLWAIATGEDNASTPLSD